jgi:hypothetical protein
MNRKIISYTKATSFISSKMFQKIYRSLAFAGFFLAIINSSSRSKTVSYTSLAFVFIAWWMAIAASLHKD